MSIASQDFRDGAALGARILAERVLSARLMGIVLDNTQLRAMAEAIRLEYGGAREAARVE